MNPDKGKKNIPDVSIILVSYNDKTHLEENLLSLDKMVQDFDLEILVVDNNSTDGSQDLIQRCFPQVKLICNQENLGFARANNQAIQQSSADLCLFLNPDTILSSEALGLMIEEIKGHSDVGAVGPALLRRKGCYQVSFGRKVNFGSEFLQKCFLNPYYRLKLKRDQGRKKVGWLSGACLLVRREVLREVGLFDEKFFLYFEDIDLCLRIKQTGGQLIYLPRARVFHAGGMSTSLDKASSRLEYRKSQLYFYQKHNSRISLRLLRLYLFLKIFIVFFIGQERKKEENRELFWLLKRR